MNAQIRQSKFLKVLWLCLSIHIFNICFDTQDATPDYLKEDLSINDQETFAEIVIESIMGFDDTFTEYDDNDFGTKAKKKLFSIKLTLPIHLNFEALKQPDSVDPNTDFENTLPDFYNNTDSPPPKV